MKNENFAHKLVIRLDLERSSSFCACSQSNEDEDMLKTFRSSAVSDFDCVQAEFTKVDD
jgi:hypothetical protein